MAGRGRVATLPAWMTQAPPPSTSVSGGGVVGGGGSSISSSIGPPRPPPAPASVREESNGRVMTTHRAVVESTKVEKGQFEDAPVATPLDRKERSDREKDHRSSRDGDRYREREKRHRGDRDDEDARSSKSSHHRSSRHKRSRSREREKSKRSRSPTALVPRSQRSNKKRNFDVMPPGVTPENAAEYAAQAILQRKMAALSGAVGPESFGPPSNSGLTGADAAQTRHARRVYVGGIGPEVTDADIKIFFNDVIDRGLGTRQPQGHVVSVYINHERHFAFVEMQTVELTTACMELDGIVFNGQPLKVRRPNDYNPSNVPPQAGPIPVFNLAALGVVSTTVADGEGKVFVGGIPYHLEDEQIKELLQAFGLLKSFHLVRDPGSNHHKGYAFCEYVDHGVTDQAIAGLNNMALGDKTLTLRRASTHPPGPSSTHVSQGTSEIPTAALAGSTAFLTSTPTRILVLMNMVTPDELLDNEEYEDIVEDIRGECSKYGLVQSIVIPRPGSEHVGAIGKVFLEFDQVSSAQDASKELHGRGFANRTVAASFFDEAAYARKELG